MFAKALTIPTYNIWRKKLYLINSVTSLFSCFWGFPTTYASVLLSNNIVCQSKTWSMGKRCQCHSQCPVSTLLWTQPWNSKMHETNWLCHQKFIFHFKYCFKISARVQPKKNNEASRGSREQEWLRELRLFILKKRQLRGDLTTLCKYLL